MKQLLSTLFMLVAIFDVTLGGCQRSVQFPCPAADDISPCVCSHDQGVIDIECIGLTQDDYQRVFAQHFPDIYIGKLNITTKEQIDISEGFANLRITQLVLNGPVYGDLESTLTSSASDMKELTIESSELTSFPFSLLPEMTILDMLILDNCPKITKLDTIVSGTLEYFSARYCGLTSLPTGVIDGAPALIDFILYNNSISEIKRNTFALNCVLYNIVLGENLIKSIETEAFFDASSEGCEASLGNLNLVRNNFLELHPRSIPITRSTSKIGMTGSRNITVHPGAFFFVGTPALESISIDMQETDITHINEDVFGEVLPYVRYNGLGLQNNHDTLVCVCSAKWIFTADDEALRLNVGMWNGCADRGWFKYLTIDDFANC